MLESKSSMMTYHLAYVLGLFLTSFKGELIKQALLHIYIFYKQFVTLVMHVEVIL